jgi:hypothetical protein
LFVCEGTSVFYALNLDYFQTDFAKNFLLKYPELLKILAFLVLKWELWGPLFWIVPIKTHWFRMLGCLGFWALHLGFQSGLRLGKKINNNNNNNNKNNINNNNNNNNNIQQK